MEMEATQSEEGEMTGQIAGGEVNKSHLPECPITVHEGDCCYDHPLFGFPCWCSTLRACEQRVREEIDREAFLLDEGDPFRQVYRKGLDAAREAVAALDHFWVDGDIWAILRDEALAAVDALRKEGSGNPDNPTSAGKADKPIDILRSEQ